MHDMHENIFKIGDVVLLRGNDLPAMTVTYTPPDVNVEKYVNCKWFDGGTLNSGIFHQDTLDFIPKEE